jgi:predicted DNA-binding ribbon-helix-helix protein
MRAASTAISALRRQSMAIEPLLLDGLRMAKRSISIAGHRTSFSLEDAFWAELNDIARSRGISLAKLVESVDAERSGANLSSALRVFVLRARQSRAP